MWSNTVIILIAIAVLVNNVINGACMASTLKHVAWLSLGAFLLSWLYYFCGVVWKYTVGTTYGEITAEGLSVFEPYYRKGAANHFLDLGSGKGKSLLYFYAKFPQTTSITGIEFIQQRHDAAVARIRKAFGPEAPEPACKSEYHYGPFHLYKGDFLDTQYSEVIQQANLVYVSNLCMGYGTNNEIARRLCQNKEAVVVSIKQLSKVGSTKTALDQCWQDDVQAFIWVVSKS
eukprot:gnl/MRDRNA2_/MRDRNA2_15801_c0_seq1.p1 gnl/MRDRNA2_/MRDRNA2_15801_c0~~gnl/MRDRNA2_/MRDRNA2_15801_c0_seq1.p1  ORF type:complete len:231 (+),score=25.60 gnl/MRDRNA2_/MRDRNA2_15801_c0_seq1:117-809(+)